MLVLNFVIYLKQANGLGRKFIISEYWVLIPTTMLIQYVVLKRYFHTHPVEKENFRKKLSTFVQMMHYKVWKKRLQTLKCYKLANEDYQDLLKIRSGEMFLEKEYFPDCIVEGSGLRYLEDPGMAEFLLKEFRSKLGKVFPNVLYISEEAFCYMIRRYTPKLIGVATMALSFAPSHYIDYGHVVIDFGSFLQKTLTSILVSISFGLGIIGIAAANLVFQKLALISLLSGILSGYFIDLGITLAPYATSPAPLALLDSSARGLGPAKDNEPIVIIVNSRRVEQKNIAECLMAPKNDPLCDSELIGKLPKMEPTSLKYEQIAGLEDAIGVRSIKSEDYPDYFDQEIPVKPMIIEKPRSNFSRKVQKLKKVAKMVTFTEKFGDKKIIPETDSWDLTENIIEKYNEDPTELWD